MGRYMGNLYILVNITHSTYKSGWIYSQLIKKFRIRQQHYNQNIFYINTKLYFIS